MMKITTDMLPPVDPMLAYFNDWYTLQTMNGDPARRGNLARDAYLSGAAQGALLARTTSVELRVPATGVSTSGWLQTVPAPGPATLQWEDEPPSQATRKTANLTLEVFEDSPAGGVDPKRWTESGFPDGTFWFDLLPAGRSRVEIKVYPLVDKFSNLHGPLVDENQNLHDPQKITVAECIVQLDVWNGRLESAIDRHARQQLGQHANDEPSGGRDEMEQLP